MAVIVDPDLLDRYSVIFGANPEVVSMYPVGDTQRGTDVTDAWVSNTSSFARPSTGNWTSDGVVANSTYADAVCVMIGPDSGHYYAETVAAQDLTVSAVDNGITGASVTSLTVADSTLFQSANVSDASNTITIAAHGYVTGDAVIYDNGGGTDPTTGMTHHTVYFVIWDSATTFRLATSYANALAGTGIDIDAAGMAGTSHLFHDRVIVASFNNGASASEQIGGNDTSGDADGDIADGVTLQAVYSYGKDEWHTDSYNATYFDDLIRHQFPYESITSEQFEIGGGSPHANWNWWNDYSRKKVRTGGWATKTTTSTVNDLQRYTGIVTLGSVDTDAQIYYQQTSVTTTPTNFTFLGAVNEPVLIWRDDNQDASADEDYTTYLKLFLRKKGLSYSQSEIADIGVTTIQTIVNRFPLTHTTDAAITATDGQLLGLTPWRDGLTVTSQTGDGDITIGEVTFEDTTNDFEALFVVAGDTLQITSGSDLGYYTIASVDDANTLTIATDFEFSGWISNDAAVNYTIHSYWRTANKAGDGTIVDYTDGVCTDSTTVTGTFDTDSSNFTTDGVAANDVLWITEAGSEFYGLYPVISVDDSNTLTVNTADQVFDGTGSLDFRVLTDGMYLQYRDNTINVHAAATQWDYDDANATYGNRPTITITGQVWDATTAPAAGSIFNVSGSASNDGSYTVYAQETVNIVSLIPTDVLVDEADTTPNSSVTHSEGFKRVIGSNTYAFNWKCLCNQANLISTYQFVQHQLRQTTDIDWGEGTARGDITDLLMSFATPTGTGINMTLDYLDSNDINNLTLQDHSGVNRTYPFTAAGNLNFNQNLQDDASGKYWLFFTNDDAGDDLGRDYGTKDAIIVDDSGGSDIQGSISGASVAFTYDFDGNTQRGSASAGVAAPVTLVCIGKITAQFVIATGTITRTTGISITATAALERNYVE